LHIFDSLKRRKPLGIAEVVDNIVLENKIPYPDEGENRKYEKRPRGALATAEKKPGPG
jgi:hypothetical protein